MLKKLKSLIWNLKHLDDLYSMHFDLDERFNKLDERIDLLVDRFDLLKERVDRLVTLDNQRSSSIFNLKNSLDDLMDMDDPTSLESRYNDLEVKANRLTDKMDDLQSQITRLRARYL